ncbi:hypothetical protein OJAV_G00181710 [Oryzias javanicus]|uniref:BCL6B transcription repressor n=1 Tax=Oryzias javanicus TaxID=123683 RepID=A0A437CDV9_ORYJA|nr:hypothetical protein OJAV_G00181710 [Oryzias javanicus]
MSQALSQGFAGREVDVGSRPCWSGYDSTQTGQMEAVQGYRGDGDHVVRADGYVKEFTRHSNDVLLNLNELRHRSILTDTTLVVGSVQLRAHCAVLVACSGFFYSLYSRQMLRQGRGGGGEQLMTVSLPNTLDPSCVSLLLDFMYTSRLPLTPSMVSGVLAVAAYLQMDHVANTCREFMQLHCTETMTAKSLHFELDSRVCVTSVTPKRGDLPSPGVQRSVLVENFRLPVVQSSFQPGAFLTCQPSSEELKEGHESSPKSPACSSCHPNSPAESSTCSKNLEAKSDQSDSTLTPDPKACNWKKYKYIVLNRLCSSTKVKEEMEELQCQASPDANRMNWTPKTPTEACPGEVPSQIDRQGQASCYEGSGRAPPLGPPPSENQSKVSSSHKHEPASPVSPGSIFPKLPQCDPETAQMSQPTMEHKKQLCALFLFQRHCRNQIHLIRRKAVSLQQKPYRCDTCGARFVQVAHLRAHVLIHTGEKPYPCHTCGTRFRHLQTLKSHLRIHTGEKPYSCEKCDLHFRHKSQLRLHLRQKHGAVTNTKIRYKVLTEPFQSLLQAC